MADTINITNTSKRQITLPGTIVLAPGETKPAPASVLDNAVVKAWLDTKDLTRADAKQASNDPSALKAVHHGGGRYVVKRGDEVVAEGLTKDDAAAFNALPDEDKEDFVKKD